MAAHNSENILRRILAQFSPLPPKDVELEWRPLHFDKKTAPAPYMVFLTLVYGLGFNFVLRPYEKMAWLIPITFNGLPMCIGHQKFGLWIVAANQDEAHRILPELFARLRKAEQVTERILQPEVEKRIRAGQITVDNQFFWTRDRYLFFRQRAIKAYTSKRPLRSKTRKVNWGPIKAVTTFSDPFKSQREGFYFASAAVDAYFSHLEHVLVLLLPFSGFRQDRDDLQAYIRKFWTDKFKRIFDLSKNEKARKLYEELREVKERLRNSVAHGGFEKGIASLFVHFKEIGAAPATLSTHPNNKGLFRLFPIQEMDFEKACHIFDEADCLLKEDESRYGYKYAETGLPVAFSVQAISSYEDAMKSDKSFNSLMKKNIAFLDVYENMDW